MILYLIFSVAKRTLWVKVYDWSHLNIHFIVDEAPHWQMKTVEPLVSPRALREVEVQDEMLNTWEMLTQSKCSSREALVEQRSHPLQSLSPPESAHHRNAPFEFMGRLHYSIAPSCGSATKKVHCMHQSHPSIGKQSCSTSAVPASLLLESFSQLVHYFWSQSHLPRVGLTFESITARLHQNSRGNQADDTGKMKESHPPVCFIASFMISDLAEPA